MDPVFLPKLSHIADLRSCELMDCSLEIGNCTSRRIYDILDEDLSQFQHPLGSIDEGDKYISQIMLDPDNQLSSYWKGKFYELCKSFCDIITPLPGRCNGAFGRVSTKINFTSTPPANLKTYLPKYSQEMMRTLGEKMDTLESWGVLRKPEELGIILEFVVPSMLTPKPEEDQFRLVTDFSSLN